MPAPPSLQNLCGYSSYPKNGKIPSFDWKVQIYIHYLQGEYHLLMGYSGYGQEIGETLYHSYRRFATAQKKIIGSKREGMGEEFLFLVTSLIIVPAFYIVTIKCKMHKQAFEQGPKTRYPPYHE